MRLIVAVFRENLRQKLQEAELLGLGRILLVS
jgi:hypothetical protein